MLVGCASAEPTDGTTPDEVLPDRAPDEGDPAGNGTTGGTGPSTPPAPPGTSPGTTPPPSTPPAVPGTGFATDAANVLRNATGVCGQAADGGVLRTAACSGADPQKFTVYQMPDNGYELCLRETLKKTTSGSGDEEYHATCLSKVGEAGVRFADIVLSKKVGSAFEGQAGHILPEANDLFGWKDSPRKLTKDSGGTVVLGNKSGNADQRWTFSM